MYENHVRSIAKSISWRVLGTIATILIVFIFIQRIDVSLLVGGIEALAKTVLYYIHERIWNRISLGKKTEKI